MKKSIISIHDIMPHTLENIKKIILMLDKLKCSPPTLLVVPGKKWSRNEINFLKNLQKDGYEIAGHGWHHETKDIKTIYHKIHSTLISRNVAEHLSLNNNEIINLMKNCSNWFIENNFEKPITYIPPAWALGNISQKDISESSYNIIETLSGIYIDGKFKRMPLVGYETDNFFRVVCVTIINLFSENISFLMDKPLRISIHPFDLSYLLSKNLKRILQSERKFYSYKDYYQSLNPF